MILNSSKGRILDGFVDGEDQTCRLCGCIESALLHQNRLPDVVLESIAHRAVHAIHAPPAAIRSRCRMFLPQLVQDLRAIGAAVLC